MKRLPLLLLCVFALAFSNCNCGSDDPSGSGTGETNCTNRLDDDNNGLVDCNDPACGNEPICQKVVDHCSRQRGPVGGGGCGDIVVDLNIRECLDGTCQWPAPLGDDGKPATLQVDYDITFVGFGDGGQDTQPQSFLGRYIDPKGIDGHTYTCAELLDISGGKNATQAQRSLLDDNANINMTYRYYAPFNWTTGKHFPWSDHLCARSTKPVIFWAEAWYGQRDSGQSLPSGNRAATYCKENVDISSAGPVPMKFTFAPPM